MNNSIKILKDQLTFNRTPSIVSLKKRLKYISKMTGQPLMKVQERVCAMFGYSDWYHFQNNYFYHKKQCNEDLSHFRKVILSKEEPKDNNKGIKKTKEYIRFANHALLDESLWLEEGVLRLHTELHISREEIHSMFVQLICNLYDQVKDWDFPCVMLIDPNRAEIGDWIALQKDFSKYITHCDEIIYLDFSEDQELKENFFTSNVKKIMFRSKESLLKIFLTSYCRDLIEKIPNILQSEIWELESIDVMNLEMMRKYFTNLSDFKNQIELSELIKRYETFINKPFIAKSMDDSYKAINVDNIATSKGYIVAYFGENKNPDDFCFFENLRLSSLCNSTPDKKLHFYYSKKEIFDSISRGKGVMCFIKGDENPFNLSGVAGNSIFKADALIDYRVDNSLLFYRRNDGPITKYIPISFDNTQTKNSVDDRIIEKLKL